VKDRKKVGKEAIKKGGKNKVEKEENGTKKERMEGGEMKKKKERN